MGVVCNNVSAEGVAEDHDRFRAALQPFAPPDVLGCQIAQSLLALLDAASPPDVAVEPAPIVVTKENTVAAAVADVGDPVAGGRMESEHQHGLGHAAGEASGQHSEAPADVAVQPDENVVTGENAVAAAVANVGDPGALGRIESEQQHCPGHAAGEASDEHSAAGAVPSNAAPPTRNPRGRGRAFQIKKP